MRLLGKDVDAGQLRLRVDSLDDLWALRTLVQEGDVASALTHRTAEAPAGSERQGKMEKRPMRLGVRVESVEWHDFDDHLRILGPIVAGPQDHGRHHTLIVRPDGTELTLDKPRGLHDWHLRLVDEAVRASQSPQVLLLAIDDSEAQFATLASYGVRMLGSLPSAGQGKRFAGAAEAKRQFYDAALASLRTLRPDPSLPVLVVGPGWWREEFIEHVRAAWPEGARSLRTEAAGHGGRTGIQEAIRNGAVGRLGHQSRVERETLLVEAVLERLGRGDGLVAVGPAESARAVAAGAAETLLVGDALVRSGSCDGLILQAKHAQAETVIVSGSHDAGVRLARLGGVAALLRYAVATP